MNTTDTTPRLTSLSHGGGCGCKIAPGVLAGLLEDMPAAAGFADLLVGRETSDDAAVYRLDDSQAIVATTDFFMPIVDDPFDFGRIAAANALSDLYAMGATPLFALAIVGMPVAVLPAATIREILRGGEAVCAQAGIPVAGGHSIDSVEPIYGLAAIGRVHPRDVRRNATARAGDRLVLGKPLGVGIHSAAFKKGLLDAAGYDALIETTTRLNRPGIELARLDGVHAMTDVTGFGLLGHLLEIARGSGLGAQLEMARVPLLPATRALAEAGATTGASARNWGAYGDRVDLADALQPLDRAILTDPQTSGGLLVACAPDAVDAVLATFATAGFGDAAVIGSLAAGEARVGVR
ncbi:MAG TPA: selenide, water dikinase SelD [Dokdonella sp.]|uniref:selenide, water dikinase SelD n=1 Tax=Dokdonella sp. TaxID=2291710 RepID=UPI002CC424B2|nr:selenide, water dikinase SelD [Dokdonella sp.]HUD41721.1 selenide, water dikinase SelD [Dokdonella sp.]